MRPVKIYTSIKLQLTDNPAVYLPVSETSYEYEGPIAKADRSIQNAAKGAAAGAGSTASGYGATAGGIQAGLLPQLQQEATHPTGYDPTTQNNMLVAGEQGAGGSTGAVTGDAGLNALRTRNTGNLATVFDQAARRGAQTNSTNALDVQNNSAELAQKKQQQALGQLQGLYGTDVGAQLKGLGLQNEDEDTELKAGQQGWAQNTLATIAALKGGQGSQGPASYV